MIPLAFQGGTALRFLYSIHRYSEDLDFALERPDRGYDFRSYLQRVRGDLQQERFETEVKANDQKIVHSAFVSFPGLLFDVGLTPQRNEKLSVKVEVDTRPPAGAVLATSIVRRHATLQIQHHDQSSLLAGKLHAVLQRTYPKGRDIYDLIWYLSDRSWPPPNLVFLNNALRQTGWDEPLVRRERRTMKDTHPSLETLARWLAGELEHEEVLREVAPHLVASCPVCQHLREEIRRLQDESGHWNEVVAVLETQEAPALAARLQDRPQEERMRLASEDESLHTWGLCQYFLQASREAVFQDPAQAVDWARLAVRLSDHLSQSYHPDSIRDLRARAYAQLGNAHRVLGELKGAEHAFLCARECLEASGTGDLSMQAEVLGLEASLCLDQRRFEDAGNLLDRSLALFREVRDAHGSAKALLKKARLFYVQEDFQQAISLLRQSEPEIQQAGDLHLSARARQNLLVFLTLAGRHQEADELLPEVQALFRDLAEPLDRIKLRWAEASIAQGLGRPAEAETLYREVRSAFLSLEKGYDAALVLWIWQRSWRSRGGRRS